VTQPRPRDRSLHARLTVAADIDAVADARDVEALARDRAAEVRDVATAQLDAEYERVLSERAITAAAVELRIGELRIHAAQQRARGAEQRQLAADDRQCAAKERALAARERQRARADREALARDLDSAAVDALTGAHSRGAGLLALDQELDRCRRMDGLLVAAYVDLVGLKTLNDTFGHSAGDDLLKHTVTLIRAHVRTYDLVIRVGGDEFVCAMSNMTLPDARDRFSRVGAALADAPVAGAIRTGLAALAPGDTATELIARADGELVARRSVNRANRPERNGHTPR
jgi:diguanylate cyclase (GGDEF)-like protein